MLTISYIKILKLLIYTLNYKANKKDKLNDKSKKGILIGFELFNNYLIFLSKMLG